MRGISLKIMRTGTRNNACFFCILYLIVNSAFGLRLHAQEENTNGNISFSSTSNLAPVQLVPLTRSQQRERIDHAEALAASLMSNQNPNIIQPAPRPPIKITRGTNHTAFLPPGLPSALIQASNLISVQASNNLFDVTNFGGSAMMIRYEYWKRLAFDTNVNPVIRKSYERSAEWAWYTLTNNQTNAALWKACQQAGLTRDPVKISHAERDLADYLIESLSSIKGTNYSTNMSLTQILKEYEKERP